MKLKLGVLITLVLSIVMATQVFAIDMNEGKVVKGRTMIPLRGAFEDLGFNVSWDNATNTATLEDDNHNIVVKKGDKAFVVDGQTYQSDVEPQLINGSLYIPLRSLGDKIGAETSWNEKTEFAKIVYNNDRTFVYARTQELDTSSHLSPQPTLELYLYVLEEMENIYSIYGEAMTYMNSDPEKAKELLVSVKSKAGNLDWTDLSVISEDAENSLHKFTYYLSKSADEAIKHIDGRKANESEEVLYGYFLNSNEYAHYAASGIEDLYDMFDAYWAQVKPKN